MSICLEQRRKGWFRPIAVLLLRVKGREAAVCWAQMELGEGAVITLIFSVLSEGPLMGLKDRGK